MPISIEAARDRLAETATSGLTGPPVVYQPPGGGRSEFGVITGVSTDYVFVRYDGDMHSKATSPWMLDFREDS